jgi:hypothetical protein
VHSLSKPGQQRQELRADDRFDRVMPPCNFLGQSLEAKIMREAKMFGFNWGIFVCNQSCRGY